MSAQTPTASSPATDVVRPGAGTTSQNGGSGSQDAGSARKDLPGNGAAPADATTPILAATDGANSAAVFSAPATLETGVTIKAGQVFNTLQTVLDTSATMKTDGGSRVELKLPLQGGGELTVKMTLEQGQWKPVFHTDSPEMRQALTQGWQNFSAAAQERGSKISAPSFETPNGHPQPGGHEPSNTAATTSNGNPFSSPGKDRRGQQDSEPRESSYTQAKPSSTPATSMRPATVARREGNTVPGLGGGLSLWA